MLTLLFLLLAVGAMVSVLMPLVYATQVYRGRRGRRQVTCPETQEGAAVEVDALHCATTALSGAEYLRLSSCSRWPEKQACEQDCVYELLQERPREEARLGPHLPHAAVLAGAGMAWLLGGLWYADPVFGRTWMRLNGLTQAAARARAELVLPYLVPLAGFLVLGYILAWGMTRSGREGILREAWLGVLLCSVFLAVDLLMRSLIPGPWLTLTWVDITYALTGSVVTGAVVGGWPALARAVS